MIEFVKLSFYQRKHEYKCVLKTLWELGWLSACKRTSWHGYPPLLTNQLFLIPIRSGIIDKECYNKTVIYFFFLIFIICGLDLRFTSQLFYLSLLWKDIFIHNPSWVSHLLYFTYSALFKRAVNLVGQLLNCEERIKFNSLFPPKYSVSKRGLRYSRDAILNSVKRSFEYVKAPKIFCVKKRDICHAICITIFKRL